MSKQAKWVPLEANPDVLNNFMLKLGLKTEKRFIDVFGFDDDLLQFIPQPCSALFLLFPVTDKYERFRKQEIEQLKKNPQHISEKVVFTLQTIPNACGTIGLLHSLLNGLDEDEILVDGALKRIKDKLNGRTCVERAQVLEEDEDLASIHREIAHQGQSEVPEDVDDVDLHFDCFVSVDEHLYELDGRKPFPIKHGKCHDLLRDAIRVVKEFMARDPENINFTTIAFAK